MHTNFHCTYCGILFQAQATNRHGSSDCPNCGGTARVLVNRSHVMEMYEARICVEPRGYASAGN